MSVGAILPPSPRVEHHWNVSGSLNAKKRGSLSLACGYQHLDRVLLILLLLPG